MIICKDAENNPCTYNHCCVSCIEKNTCKTVCELVKPEDTEDVIKEECDMVDEPKEVILLEQHYPTLVEAITDLSVRKKAIEDEEKQMKEMLITAMKECHLKSWDNDLIKITYVAPTTRTSIDSAKLKKEKPDIAEKYSKTSSVSESVRITVK